MDLAGLPGGPVVKNPLASAVNMDSITGPGRSTCRGADKPLHHNC